MGEADIDIHQEDWDAFHAIVLRHRNGGTWRYQKELHAFLDDYPHWRDVLRPDDRRLFHCRSIYMQRHQGRLDHHRHRFSQLVEFALRGEGWFIYYADTCKDPLHRDLHGLTLLTSSIFWQDYIPPNGWDCDCRIRAVPKWASIEPRGGDPEKAPPKWIGPVKGKPGKMTGIEAGFERNTFPSMHDALVYVYEGRADA